MASLSIDSLTRALLEMPLLRASLYALAWNVVIFLAVLAVGGVLVRLFARRRCAPPPAPLSAKEVAIAVSCVVGNTGVTVAGLVLCRVGVLSVAPSTPAKVILDVVVLVLAMDLGMYLAHRVAHHPRLYALVHATHHAYENPRPLSLFVLNPAEVLGFGGLWLAVICVYPASATGMVIYLTLNVAFGLAGHLGVEPFPRRWTRAKVVGALSTSTFHAQHHRDKAHNFGFYTVVWDRLLATLSPDYDRDFDRATAGYPEPEAHPSGDR